MVGVLRSILLPTTYTAKVSSRPCCLPRTYTYTLISVGGGRISLELDNCCCCCCSYHVCSRRQIAKSHVQFVAHGESTFSLCAYPECTLPARSCHGGTLSGTEKKNTHTQPGWKLFACFKSFLAGQMINYSSLHRCVHAMRDYLSSVVLSLLRINHLCTS